MSEKKQSQDVEEKVEVEETHIRKTTTYFVHLQSEEKVVDGHKEIIYFANNSVEENEAVTIKTYKISR